MKRLLVVVLLALSWPLLQAQVIYVSTLTNELFRLDLATCRLDFVSQTPAKLFDITFHPDGTLYGITPGGELMRVDTTTGDLMMIHDFEGMNFNSLTTSAEGIIYTIGSEGHLWSFNPARRVSRYHGHVGFPAAGDLAFSEGALYLAATDDRIVRIDPSNPGNSHVIIRGDIPGDIFGIVSYAEDCEAISTYAITDHLSDIYEIDFNKGSLSLVCSLPIEVSGGASTYEFLGSSSLEVTVTNITPTTCFTQSGSISFDVNGGVGALQYSLDGVNYGSQADFTSLPGGDYTLYVMDSIGCMIAYPFSIQAADGPRIDQALVTHETCNAKNGSITLLARGGASPLQYALDDGPMQLHGEFTGLSGGSYTLHIEDQAGCSTDTLIQLAAAPMSAFADLNVISTRCDSANGRVIFLGATGSPPFSYSITGRAPQASGYFENLVAGNYMATLTDRYGCIASEAFSILPSSSPRIESIVIHHPTCGEANGHASIIAMHQEQTYSFSRNGITWQENPVFEDMAAGQYTFYIRDGTGCMTTYPAEILSTPPITFEFIEITGTACGETNGAVNFEIRHAAMPVWADLNGQSPSSGNRFETLAAGEYLLHLEDAMECVIDTFLSIPTDQCPIFIPNVFSPDRDGINDHFALRAWDGFDAVIESYLIYDRWGNLMYDARQFQLQSGDSHWWDGTVRGEDAPSGVYTYLIGVQYENGETEIFSGDVTIVR